MSYRIDHFFRLPPATVIEWSGRDRLQLLHNLSTQKVAQLAEGSTAELFLCDVKGRSLCHGWILHQAEVTLLVTTHGLQQVLLDHLDRYIFREDVQLADRSDHFHWIAASGLSPVPDRYSFCKELVLPNGSRLHAPWRWGGDGSWIIAMTSTHAEDDLQLAPPSTLLSPEQFDAIRIRNNWPWFGVDIDPGMFPQETTREAESVHYQKGCYLGQETIARLDALGQVQKKMCRLSVSGPPPAPRTALRNQEGVDVGSTRSSAPDPSGGNSIAFAVVKRPYWEAGTELECGQARAIVTDFSPDA
ncbi:MAG: YgfZ/GcvT domain-containing protein [Pirellulaceae bacterium]